MTRISSRARLLLVGLLLFWSGVLPVQAKLYRWVDDEGVVHYTDTVPPNYVERERTEFSDRGIAITRVPRAKTPEELREEQELERLRTGQKTLLERMRLTDQTLLRTFRSEEDLLRTRDSQLGALDVTIQVERGNMLRQENTLDKLRAEAANLERAGKPVPERLQTSIAKLTAALRENHEAIAERERQKETIRVSFAKDLARFRQLLSEAGQRSKTLVLRPILHQVVVCSDAAECERAWSLATQALSADPERELRADKEGNLWIASPPERSNEVQLILARIPHPEERGSGASLFLELQCQISVRGGDLCDSPKFIEFVDGFRDRLQSE